MIIMDCPLQINFIQRFLSNNRDCWTHGKSLYVTIAPGITVPINCYLRSSQKKIAKLSPGRQLAALEGFIQQVNLRRSREYDDDPELVEPVIVEDVQDLIPLMSLRVLKDERRAFEEQGYVVRRVIASASIPPAGPSASETGTREASGPTVEPPETNEDGHEDEVMEAVTKALKAARDAYDSTGELSRKTRSALVEMRHEAYKSAAEIVDATWRLLTRDGWRIEMRNPQSKKSEARYVNPQWTSHPNDERGFFPTKAEAVLYAFGVGAEALCDDVVGTVDAANRKLITDACDYWIEQGKLGPPPAPTSEVLPSPRAETEDYFDTESGREARVLERRNSLCLVELDGDANYEGPAYTRLWMKDPREAAGTRRETAPRVTVVKGATPTRGSSGPQETDPRSPPPARDDRTVVSPTTYMEMLKRADPDMRKVLREEYRPTTAVGRRRELGPDPRSEGNDPPNSQDTETWDDERSRSRSQGRRDLRSVFDGAAELDRWPSDGEDRDRRADESSGRRAARS